MQHRPTMLDSTVLDELPFGRAEKEGGKEVMNRVLISCKFTPDSKKIEARFFIFYNKNGLFFIRNAQCV